MFRLRAGTFLLDGCPSRTRFYGSCRQRVQPRFEKIGNKTRKSSPVSATPPFRAQARRWDTETRKANLFRGKLLTLSTLEKKIKKDANYQINRRLILQSQSAVISCCKYAWCTHASRTLKFTNVAPKFTEVAQCLPPCAPSDWRCVRLT